MGGGLMQLVAYGAQDIYLTGNPQITFFKVVYRRHTNFSMEEIVQSASGTVNFGNEVTYTISRNGDLVHKMYFEYTMNDSNTGDDTRVSNFGNTLLKEVEIEIGGQKIDTHYSHWLTTWSDLTEPNVISSNCTYDEIRENEVYKADRHSATLYQKMSGNVFQNDADTNAQTLGNVNKYQVPLRFWFNRNPGLALPLIALQYHEVKIKINFEQLSNLLSFTSGDIALKNGRLFVQYIYLDTDERRRFAQVSHEYLIEQLQFQKGEKSTSFDLNFNHPIKEIIWGGSNVDFGSASETTEGNGDTQTILRGSNLRCDKTTMRPSSNNSWKIVLNGHDRSVFRHSTYFTRQQIYDYHTGSGSVCDSDCIAVYSFALKPEEHQPSGSCNFSRIDTAELVSQTQTNGSINIYAINYNVLRIMSGMGGLAYSN